MDLLVLLRQNSQGNDENSLTKQSVLLLGFFNVCIVIIVIKLGNLKNRRSVVKVLTFSGNN